MSDGPGTLILEVNMVEQDNSPVQFISARLLAHYRAVEAELQTLRTTSDVFGTGRCQCCAGDRGTPPGQIRG